MQNFLGYDKIILFSIAFFGNMKQNMIKYKFLHLKDP